MFGYFKKIFSSFLALSFKKQTIIVVSLVLIISAIFYAQQYFSKRNEYLIEKAQKASLTEIVTESGEILTDGKTVILSPTNGNVTELYVQNGSQVKKDQILLKVESSATEQDKQTAYANYLTAKATYDADNAALFTLQSKMFSAWKVYTDKATNSTYENADKSPNTSNRILTDFTTSQDDWYAAEANYKNQQVVLAKDQAALNSAYIAYQATQNAVIKAPISGIINNLAVAKGDSVTAQTLLNPSPTPVLLISNNQNNMEAVIQVGQTNISKIKTGQKTTIKPDPYKDITYQGTVDRMDNIGTNNQGVITYNVYIKIANPDDKLRAGMTLDGDIVTNELNNVLSVPNSAVVLNQGKKTVRILKNNKIVYLPVLVGIKSDTRTQILEGISEGQEIIVSLTNAQLQRPGFFGL